MSDKIRLSTMLREYQPYAIAAVGAVLVSNGMMLLVKRSSEPGKGMWSIPGGVIEAGESVYEAARRELVEETGVDAKPLGVIKVVNIVVRDPELRVRYHYVVVAVLFDNKTMAGRPRPGGDAIDVAFMSIDEVLSNPSVSGVAKAIATELVKVKPEARLIDVHDVVLRNVI